MSTTAWIASAVIASIIWLVVIFAMVGAGKATDAKDHALHKLPKKDSDE